MGAHAGEPMGKTVGMTVGILIIIPVGMQQVIHGVGTCKRRTYDLRG